MASIDISVITSFSNGVAVLNCTPHPISFLDGEEVVVAPPSGATLKAASGEEPVGQHGAAQLVKTLFMASPEGEAELAVIEEHARGVLVVGSIISAQAYPGRVVAMVPAPGFERVPPAEKRMAIDKFTIF